MKIHYHQSNLKTELCGVKAIHRSGISPDQGIWPHSVYNVGRRKMK